MAVEYLFTKMAVWYLFSQNVWYIFTELVVRSLFKWMVAVHLLTHMIVRCLFKQMLVRCLFSQTPILKNKFRPFHSLPSLIHSVGSVVVLSALCPFHQTRVLKSDFARYNLGEDDDSEDLEQDDNGWKIIQTDVFRFPPLKSLFCAILGQCCCRGWTGHVVGVCDGDSGDSGFMMIIRIGCCWCLWWWSGDNGRDDDHFIGCCWCLWWWFWWQWTWWWSFWSAFVGVCDGDSGDNGRDDDHFDRLLLVHFFCRKTWKTNI